MFNFRVDQQALKSEDLLYFEDAKRISRLTPATKRRLGNLIKARHWRMSERETGNGIEPVITQTFTESDAPGDASAREALYYQVVGESIHAANEPCVVCGAQQHVVAYDAGSYCRKCALDLIAK